MSIRRTLVLSLVALAAFAALGALGDLARADEVGDRGARMTALETRQRALGEERRSLAAVYADRTTTIAALKAQPSSWSRDRKLQALLAESKDMAAQLDRRDAELRALAAALDGERRALLVAVDRALAAQPPPEAERAAELGKQRAQLASALAQTERPLRIADESIAATDDAADLDYKAAALAQSERSLRLEEQRLVARASWFHKQARLTRSRARAEEADVFRDDEPRRATGAAGKSAGAGEGRGDTTSASPPTPTGPPVGGTTGGPPSTVTPPAATVDLAADPSVILSDVVAAGTIDELRRAERSGDPESMARAAERASREVQLRAERLRARRIEMEQRARQLRGEPQ